MKKINYLLFSLTLLIAGISNVNAQCTTAANTYNDLVTAGGAPCFDGLTCAITDPDFTGIGIGIYGSEAYQLTDVLAGFDYVFDMCSGFGAGAWVPEITILSPSGVVDASNFGNAGSATHGNNCSISWTASESGTYLIIINELGTFNGNAPNQVNCNTTLAIDNGNPTVSCGVNPAPCLQHDAGIQDVFLSEYTAIPLSQVNPLTPSALVANLGPNPVTNVTVDVNIYDGTNAIVFSTSMNQASLASGASTTLTATSSFTPTATDFYLAEYVVSINEVDDIPGNDTIITAIEITDSLYARDFFYLTGNTDLLDGPWFVGVGNNGQLGNVFSVENDAELVSANAVFGGGFEIGDQTQANLYSMSGNTPGALIASSSVLTVAESDTPVINYQFSFPSGTTLSAGNDYLISVQQNAASSERFGLFSALGLYTENTSFIRQNNNAWLEIDEAGIGEQTFMIRANLADINTQTCEITNLTAGTQTACNIADNSYTQQVTVTYSNPPATGQLSVNGQNFNITSSP